jgi:hypothetical protein
MEKRKSYPENKKSHGKNKQKSETKLGESTQDLFNKIDKDSQLFHKILNADESQKNNLNINRNSLEKINYAQESESNDSTKNNTPENLPDQKETKVKKKRKANEVSKDQEAEKEIEKKTKSSKKKATRNENEENQVKSKNKDKNKQKNLNDKDAASRIRTFMIEQNRPYSVQNVVDLMKGQIKKTQCQNILNKLVQDEVLIMKEYNSVIYLANQNHFDKVEQIDIEKVEKEIEESKTQISKLKDMNTNLNTEFKNLNEELSDEELNKRLSQGRKEIQEIQNAIKKIQSKKQEEIPPEKLKEASSVYEQCKNNFKKTKRICLNVIDYLCESTDLSRKQIFVIFFNSGFN